MAVDTLHDRYKIALLGDWFLPHAGGIEIQMHDLAEQLTLAGHEVHVVTPIPGPTRMGGFQIHRLRARRVPLFGFVATLHPFVELAELLRRERYDVVHCHTSYIAPTAYGGAYLCQKLAIPTVITFHSVLAHFAHLLAAADRWLHWSNWQVLFSGVSRFVTAAIERIVAPHPVYLLPNAIDLAFWRQSQRAAQRDPEVVLVTVTRFSPRKRVDSLLKTVAQVRSARPEIPIRLLVVGEGPLRPYLERLIARLGLNTVVHLLGYQPRTQIRTLFSQAHIFVSACAIESFGLAALEARCAGLPIVARSSGVDQFITHNQNGLLATTDQELADFLLQLIQDPARRQQIARHNQLTAPPFGWEHVLPQHLAFYHQATTMVHR